MTNMSKESFLGWFGGNKKEDSENKSPDLTPDDHIFLLLSYTEGMQPKQVMNTVNGYYDLGKITRSKLWELVRTLNGRTHDEGQCFTLDPNKNRITYGPSRHGGRG